MLDFLFYGIIISGDTIIPMLPFLLDQKIVPHKIQSALAITIGILYVWFLLWLACTNESSIVVIGLLSEFIQGDFSNFDYCLTTNIWRWIKGIGGFVIGISGIWIIFGIIMNLLNNE